MEILPEPVTKVIKRGRGRAKKEINIAEIRKKMQQMPKKETKPKKEINISETREIIKRGPKTNLTADRNYYNQWYSDHYKGVCMTCPSCKNPNVNVAKIHRHMRSLKCLKDTTLNKYSVYGI